MAIAHKGPVIPFVLAGLLGLAASTAWVFAAESSARPAVLLMALGWIGFSAAIASIWVGSVRLYRNRSSGAAKSRGDRGRPPRDAHPST